MITSLLKKCKREARAEKILINLYNFCLIPSENDDNPLKNTNMRARSASGNFYGGGSKLEKVDLSEGVNLASAKREQTFCLVSRHFAS